MEYEAKKYPGNLKRELRIVTRLLDNGYVKKEDLNAIGLEYIMNPSFPIRTEPIGRILELWAWGFRDVILKRIKNGTRRLLTSPEEYRKVIEDIEDSLLMKYGIFPDDEKYDDLSNK